MIGKGREEREREKKKEAKMKEEALVTDDPAMTIEEVSMERSKSFVKALQVTCYIFPHIDMVLSEIHDLS